MADVIVDTENNTNPKQLFGQGVRAYVLQDYEGAVKALSKASELLSTQHENELHDSLGDVYLYYGKSLLELTRKEGGPLGEAVMKNVDQMVGDESEETIESEGEGEETEQPGEEKQSEAENKEKVAAETAAGSSKEGEASTADEANEEEELTDLQVAWEVLELAKKIFTSRSTTSEDSTEANKKLAETLIVLGEISLESGNFESAVEDISEGLKIQKTVLGSDSRTIAETLYKLGTALSTNGQIDQAIESFNASVEYLNNRIAKLKKSDGEEHTNEINELQLLLPELEEKVSDMKNLKIEIAQKAAAAAAPEEAESGSEVKKTLSNGASSKQVSDISHLVKRKRKISAGDENNQTAAKKPSP